MEIFNKKISIIGAVRSGIGAAKLVKQLKGIPFVSDVAFKEKIQSNIDILESEGIAYETGMHSERIYDCDFIITSPGVPSDSAVLRDAQRMNIPIYSELEFASWFCEGKIIAVTGTNGKTTTTSLCAHVLNEAGIKAYPAGNIGNAFSEVVLDVKEDEFVVLETSSFQLDYMKNFKPFISMLLNVTPDHLDRYENDFHKYLLSKLSINKNQNESDYFIFNEDDANIKNNISNELVNRYSFSLTKEVDKGAFAKDDTLYFNDGKKKKEVGRADDLRVKGEHNIANALAVLAAARIIDIPGKKIKKAFSSFPGVEHRLEFVRLLDSVEYINDSKATNVDSVWYALRSFDKPLYLILGGRDKGNDYEQIKESVAKYVKKIYAIGESAQKVFDFFNGLVKVDICEDFETCINRARRESEPNSVVLLSPACASFDMFENYEERGKVFKQLVNNLN